MSYSLRDQIRAIARRARRLLVIHGLCWFAAVVFAVAFALCWVDYTLRLQDRGVRIILSTAFALTLLWSLRRFVVPSLQRHFSDLEVAQQVEQCFPQLGDRLSSSLDFIKQSQEPLSIESRSTDIQPAFQGNARDSLASAESAELQQVVISETEAIVRPLDLQQCLDHRATRRSLLACIPLLLAIAVVCGLDVDASTLAARRLAVPWSHESWPRWNSLEVVNPPRRIGLGQDFAVEVTDRRGRLPQHAVLEFWFEGDEEDETEAVSMQRSDDRFHFTRTNVTRSFKYRARGGDDDSMVWHSLQVVQPARLTDFRVTVHPPAYSGLEPAELSAGPIRVLEGSQVRVSGQTSRHVHSVLFHVVTGESTADAVEAVIDEDAASFTIPSLPTETVGKGQYWVELIESDGVVSRGIARANWEVVPDRAPAVTVSAPTAEMDFTAGGTLPIHVTATDDLAVHRLELRIGATTIPLFAGPELAMVHNDLPPHPDVREVTRQLDLSEFNLAANDSLEIAFVASDYKPQTSELVTRSITIISRDDFDYRSQEKQKQLFARLVDAVRLQRATRAQLESIQQQLESLGTLSGDDAGQLRASELQQQQVARLLEDSPAGAARIIADLIASMSHNGLSGSDAALRMEQMSRVLEGINRDRLPELQSELVRATKAARAENDDHDDMAALLDSVGDRQDAVAMDLQSMIDQLSQWDDFRRFPRDIARLLQDQQDQSARVNELSTIGQRFDTLSPRQRADLERASGEQLELARRFERLRTEMGQLEEQIRESDPAAATSLSDAIREAHTSGIAERMRQIGRDVARNQLGNASREQGEVEQGLRHVLGALTDSGHGDQLATDTPTKQQLETILDQLEKQLVELASRQQSLLDATRQRIDTGASPLEPGQMAREQQALAGDTKETRERMPIPGAFSFGMKMIEAAMNDAALRLEREGPDDGVRRLQQRSLSRLEQALAALNSRTPLDGGDTIPNDSATGDQSASEAPGGRQPSLSVEELRLLYAMQVDLHERTVALEQQRQGRGALEEEGQRELQQLASEQGQLAELLLEAVPTERPVDAPEPTRSTSELEDLDRSLEGAGIPGFGRDK